MVMTLCHFKDKEILLESVSEFRHTLFLILACNSETNHFLDKVFLWLNNCNRVGYGVFYAFLTINPCVFSSYLYSRV